jgi:hypothetical protein
MQALAHIVALASRALTAVDLPGAPAASTLLLLQQQTVSRGTAAEDGHLKSSRRCMSHIAPVLAAVCSAGRAAACTFATGWAGELQQLLLLTAALLAANAWSLLLLLLVGVRMWSGRHSNSSSSGGSGAGAGAALAASRRRSECWWRAVTATLSLALVRSSAGVHTSLQCAQLRVVTDAIRLLEGHASAVTHTFEFELNLLSSLTYPATIRACILPTKHCIACLCHICVITIC